VACVPCPLRIGTGISWQRAVSFTEPPASFPPPSYIYIYLSTSPACPSLSAMSRFRSSHSPTFKTHHTHTHRHRAQRRCKMSLASVLPVLLLAALAAAGSSSSSSSSSSSLNPEQHPHNRPDEAFQCDVNRETRATIAFKALELLKMNDFSMIKTGIFAGHVRI